MTRAWGMPTSFVQTFYFLENTWSTYSSPLPPMDHSHNSSIQSLSRFYTMTSSPKETMMYFGYTYAPNLTHQGAYVITKKLLTQYKEMVEDNINTTH
jgi:hypothetical protein